MTRTRCGQVSIGETLAQVLRHIDELAASDAGALSWFVQLEPADGGPSDAELAAFGGRLSVIFRLARRLRTIARQDAAGARIASFSVLHHCPCQLCQFRRCCTIPSTTGGR